MQKSGDDKLDVITEKDMRGRLSAEGWELVEHRLKQLQKPRPSPFDFTTFDDIQHNLENNMDRVVGLYGEGTPLEYTDFRYTQVNSGALMRSTDIIDKYGVVPTGDKLAHILSLIATRVADLCPHFDDQVETLVRKNSNKGQELKYTADREEYMPIYQQFAKHPMQYLDGSKLSMIIGYRMNQPSPLEGKPSWCAVHNKPGSEWEISSSKPPPQLRGTGKTGPRVRNILPVSGLSNLLLMAIQTEINNKMKVRDPVLYATKATDPNNLYGYNPQLGPQDPPNMHVLAVDFKQMDTCLTYDLQIHAAKFLPYSYMLLWARIIAEHVYGVYINESGEPVYWYLNRACPNLESLTKSELIHFVFQYMSHFSGSGFTSLINWMVGLAVSCQIVIEAYNYEYNMEGLNKALIHINSSGDDNRFKTDSVDDINRIKHVIDAVQFPFAVVIDNSFLGILHETDKYNKLTYLHPNWVNMMLLNLLLKEKGSTEYLLGLHAPYTSLLQRYAVASSYVSIEPWVMDMLHLLLDVIQMPYPVEQLELLSQHELDTLEDIPGTYSQDLKKLGYDRPEQIMYREPAVDDPEALERIRGLIFEKVTVNISDFNDAFKIEGPVLNQVVNVTRGPANVLVTGMPGSGKTLLSRYFDNFVDLDDYGKVDGSVFDVDFSTIKVNPLTSFVGIQTRVSELAKFARKHGLVVYVLKRNAIFLRRAYNLRALTSDNSDYRRVMLDLANRPDDILMQIQQDIIASFDNPVVINDPTRSELVTTLKEATYGNKEGG